MHVILINPPFVFGRKGAVTYSQCTGILSIAASLRSRGHLVTVIDALFEGENNREAAGDGLVKIGLSDGDIISRIPSSSDMIGLSVPFSHLASIAHNLIRNVKEKSPKYPW